jgi:hypothetical protein
MKTKKKYGFGGSIFQYLNKNFISHGLLNDENKWIGYRYQDNRKGFWLNKHK